MKQENQTLLIIGGIFIACLGLISLRLIQISIYKVDELSTHSFNPRLEQLESKIARGNFFDFNGVQLTDYIDGSRYYIYDDRYSHSIGYLGLGEYGLEKTLSKQLLSPTYDMVELAKNLLFDKQFEGRDIVLTLDNELQKIAQELLQNYKGAIIGIEPSTGQVKFLYSSPSFNPNTLEQEQANILADNENTPLVNRVTQGLYPPGSIFKIVPTLALMELYPDEWQTIEHTCEGSILVDGNLIRCYNNNAHGTLTIENAIALSCNTFFVNLYQYVTPLQLEEISSQLFFNDSIPSEISIISSVVDIVNTDYFSQHATYMGQGKTLVTPFHMAVLASVIANDGILMTPYWVDSIYTPNNEQILKNWPNYYANIIDEDKAKTLQSMMQRVVSSGTGIALKNIDATIGVKTGTAQNTNAPHSWVMGYVNDIEQSLAFAIIVENEEGVALTICEKLLNSFLENNRNY